MKKINTFLSLVALTILLFTSSLNAQDYKSAIGGKIGYGLIGTYKAFINEDLAFELIGGLRWSGLAGGAFVQKHSDVDGVDGLRWYVGGGATFSTWSYSGFGGGYTEVAVHANGGLEYVIENTPIVVGVDYAPGFVVVDTYDSILTYNRLRTGYGSLFARYILKGDKK